jgi:hypothetical protein
MTRPYQRRRRTPVAVVLSVLAVLAAVTWTVVLVNAGGGGSATSCPGPAAGPPPGDVLAGDALDGVAPVPPTAVAVLVRNAGGQRGQANLVAAQLGDLGFTEAAPPDNDPFYPDGDLDCVGQIRFGPAGEAGASTLALVLPCAELVRDDRADAVVEVSVGTAFGDVDPGRAASDALDQLAAPSSGTDADPEAPAAPPTVDPATLSDARDTAC